MAAAFPRLGFRATAAASAPVLSAGDATDDGGQRSAKAVMEQADSILALLG
jgi:hypothetical protein